MRISDWSSDVCSSDLWKNIQDYIVDPESLPPEEPNPLQKAELDEKLTNIDVAKRTINIREAQAAGEERRKDAELLLKRHDTIEGIKLKTAGQARKDRETDNRIDIGLAEHDLALDAAAEAGPEATKLTAIDRKSTRLNSSH